ncbi:MAG: amidohydrolase [Oscillospiraceae bacterium]|nr:amidohydrolase [Oscillospiraceae bacterium]
MMDKMKLYQEIEAIAPEIIGLSDRIWGYAELSMREYRSAADYCSLLRQAGFAVEERLTGIETAFRASFGEGSPRIGILGEFDALSGLSQTAGETRRDPVTSGGCGHGCGHNLLGAASLGAALAVKRQIEAGVLHGTVVFYGCPGEEGCAGKTFLARDGMFRDLDTALCWHPGDANEVTTGSNAASLQYTYTFTGVASHAAGAPELGRSALDGAELMNVGVQFLREHMRRCESVHYSVLDGGGPSPNVVQPTATLLYMVRSDNVRNAKELLARVDKIAEGAAMMTETSVSKKQVDGTSSTLSNRALERLLQKNLEQVPPPVYTEEERTFARSLRETYPHSGLPGTAAAADERVHDFVEVRMADGEAPLCEFVMPYVASNHFHPGSTDVGDVSWLTPTAQFTAVCWTAGAPGHSWQNVSIGKSTIAHKGALLAARVLAGTAADLMENPALLQEAREEFRKAAKDGYDCPLEDGLVPIPPV